MKHDKLESRLAAYNAGASANRGLSRRKARLLAGAMLTAGAACAISPAAEAAIVYTDVNPDFTVNAESVQFNINLGGVNRFGIVYSYSSYSVFINHFDPTATNRRMARGAAADLAKYFTSGVTIGTGENWQHSWMRLCEGSSSPGGNFLNKDGYIGIRFPTGSGTDPKYGWVRFQGGVNGRSGLVKAYAYQDSGASIRAGEAQ
jgi:hypothetical protein